MLGSLGRDCGDCRRDLFRLCACAFDRFEQAGRGPSPDASAIVASGSDVPELSVIIVAPIPELNVPSSKTISVSPI